MVPIFINCKIEWKVSFSVASVEAKSKSSKVLPKAKKERKPSYSIVNEYLGDV